MGDRASAASEDDPRIQAEKSKWELIPPCFQMALFRFITFYAYVVFAAQALHREILNLLC